MSDVPVPAPDEPCAGWTSGNWSGRCPRAAVEEVNGKHYCKPHAAGAKRSATARAKSSEKARSDRAQDEGMRARVAALQKATGFPVQTHYIPGAFRLSTEWVLVRADDLEGLTGGGTQ